MVVLSESLHPQACDKAAVHTNLHLEVVDVPAGAVFRTDQTLKPLDNGEAAQFLFAKICPAPLSQKKMQPPYQAAFIGGGGHFG